LTRRVGGFFHFLVSSVAEIDAAIEKLPVPDVDQLAHWFQGFLQRRVPAPALENRLRNAKGAPISGTRTQELMKLTCGEE
jgi:hypothetical protein